MRIGQLSKVFIFIISLKYKANYYIALNILTIFVAIAFGRYANNTSTFVDDVFAGTLVSSVICHQCHTVCHLVTPYVILSHYATLSHCMSSCHTVCHLVTLYVILSYCMSSCHTICHLVTLYVILSHYACLIVCHLVTMYVILSHCISPCHTVCHLFILYVTLCILNVITSPVCSLRKCWRSSQTCHYQYLIRNQ